MGSEWLCPSKILHQVLLCSTLFIFAVCVGITALLLDPHTFGPSVPELIYWSSHFFFYFLHMEPPHFILNFAANLITKKINIIHLHTTFAIVQLCNLKKDWQWLFLAHWNEISVTCQHGYRNVSHSEGTQIGGISQKRTMHSYNVNWFQLVVFTNNLWNGA